MDAAGVHDVAQPSGAISTAVAALWGKTGPDRAGHPLAAHLVDTVSMAQELWLHWPSPATRSWLSEPFDDDLPAAGTFFAWLADHPDGFVLNSERPPRPSYLTLHRATCWTISRASGSNWTVNYQKVCADTFEEINAWARQTGSPWSCGFCARS